MKTNKRIRLTIIPLVLLLACVHQGCTDLEEDTSSVLAIEDLKAEGDILAALSPIYRSYQKVMDYPHEQRIMTYGADDLTTWWAGNKAPLRVFDRFDYGNGENSDINWLDIPWNGYWETIYFANSLIEGLKTASAPLEVIQVADAEARFMRSLAYFNLVRGYGNVPLILDGDEPTGEEARATVLENYEAIENDLLIAQANLPQPGDVSMVGRASVAAAKTLLADVYLTWAGWPIKDASKYQLAAAKAKEIIDMNYYTLLPIDELWLLENENSRESIFSFQFSQSADIRSFYPTANNFHEARGYSDMYPERQFFLDFPEGLRKEYTFRTDIPQRTVQNGQIVPKDPATLPWQESQRNHPSYLKFALSEDLTVGNRAFGYRAVEIFRYAEVLLIFAEAQARANGGSANGEALEALNQIKRRAMGFDYLTPNDETDVTSATAEEIVTEKGWELAGEFQRWWDLVRTETVADVTVNRQADEEVELAISASQIDAKHYIAPIPFSAISTSNLVQNPEGFKIQ